MRPFRTTRLLCALLASSAAIGLPGAAPRRRRGRPVRAAGRRAGARRRGRGLPRRARRRSLAGLPEGERTAIDGFFAARGYTPFWTEPGSPRASELIDALAAAGDQALPAGRYDAEGLGVGARRPARPREVALTRAYLAYAGDLSAGVIDPSAVDDDITRKPVAAAGGGAARAARDRAGRRGAGRARAGRPRLPPADRREAPAGGSRRGPRAGVRRSPDGPTLHPEDSGPRVAELRARLARLGYLAPGGETRRPELRPGARGGGQGVPGRPRPRRRRRRRQGDARRGQRADRDAAGAGRGQPRAHPLDAARPRRRATSTSTSPTSASRSSRTARRSGTRRSSSARRRSPRPPSSPTR